MKKLLLVTMGAVVIGAGCNAPAAKPQPAVPTTSPPAAVDASAWQTFSTDPKTVYATDYHKTYQNGFSFTYPKGWTVSTAHNPRAILELYSPEQQADIESCESAHPEKGWLIACGPKYAAWTYLLLPDAYVNVDAMDDIQQQNYPESEPADIDNVDAFTHKDTTFSAPANFVFHVNAPDQSYGLEFVNYANTKDSESLLKQIVSSFMFAK